MRDVELLAPVGSFEALKAAVQNGANAVYLGGKDFGARASANNFDRDELKEAVKYAHIRGVQVFVTTNTLRKENEIEDFLEYAKFLYDIDVDAIILQDIGMARLIKRELPDFELHASTQMVAHSLEDVKYLEGVGFDRVVLAREVTLDEMKIFFIASFIVLPFNSPTLVGIATGQYIEIEGKYSTATLNRRLVLNK